MARWKYLWRTHGTNHPGNQPLLEHTTTKTHTHTTHKTKNNIQHRHHGPPKPPASNGTNFTGECNCGTSRNPSRSMQHGSVLFIDNTNFSFINLTIILCAAAQRAHWLKVSFFKIHLVIFLCRCIKTTHTNPIYLAIPYLAMSPENSSCFGRISDGGAPLSQCFQ